MSIPTAWAEHRTVGPTETHHDLLLWSSIHMLGNSDSSLSSVFKRKHNPVAACLKCGWAILQHNLALLPDRKHPEHIRKLTCGYSSVGFVFKCCDTTACHWESWQAPGCWAAASCCRLPWEGQGSLSNQQTADISGSLAFPVAPSPHHIGCLLISQQIDYAAWWIHQILLSESLFIFFFFCLLLLLTWRRA